MDGKSTFAITGAVCLLAVASGAFATDKEGAADCNEPKVVADSAGSAPSGANQQPDQPSTVEPKSDPDSGAPAPGASGNGNGHSNGADTSPDTTKPESSERPTVEPLPPSKESEMERPGSGSGDAK